ncbi:MAG: peptidoglycan DD-metalloendopeptidase family protein [Myxococcales bacterium]|nr:peptidoglycan DD-metalloendopeptidase family protein [Myxococcales bacterium]
MRLRSGLALLALGLFAATASADVPGRPSASDDFEALLRGLDQKQASLEQELATIEPELEVVHKRMMARGRAYYRLVRAGLLPVGGGFDALVDHAAAVERLRAALSRDIELEQRLRGRRETAGVELKQVRAQRAPLLIQREAMQRARSVMQQADERRDAFHRAFGGGGLSDHLAIYGASGPSSAGPLAPFAEMKGRLSFPLSGRAEVQRPSEPTTEVTGLRLTASRDTAVRAVYPGEVVFVGTSHVGRAVILDHGKGWFTVYGNLDHIEVKEGERLDERGRVGWVLRYGAKRPTLYFEVRHGKRLLDPAPWLGL